MTNYNVAYRSCLVLTHNILFFLSSAADVFTLGGGSEKNKDWGGWKWFGRKYFFFSQTFAWKMSLSYGGNLDNFCPNKALIFRMPCRCDYDLVAEGEKKRDIFHARSFRESLSRISRGGFEQPVFYGSESVEPKQVWLASEWMSKKWRPAWWAKFLGRTSPESHEISFQDYPKILLPGGWIKNISTDNGKNAFLKIQILTFRKYNFLPKFFFVFRKKKYFILAK